MTKSKIGDVLSVKVNDNHKKYLQLIAFDLTQLNSDVIRAFKKTYSSDEDPELSEIIKDDVEFYAHCVTKFGLKLNFWQMVGNISEIGNTTHILFRDTNDYGVRRGTEPIKISQNWYVWKINDDDFKNVGKLEGENRKAEIGIVISPDSIVHRMQTGKYDFVYPDFE
jgi:hypothetical protein